MIGLRVKTMGDLARQLRKCTGYMLPSLVYPVISSTKLAAFVVQHNAGRKRAGHAINDGTCIHHFLSIALAAYTCSESGELTTSKLPAVSEERVAEVRESID